MIIRRSATIVNYETYELKVDAEYCKSLTDYINSKIVNEEDYVNITIEDIKYGISNHWYTSEDDDSVLSKTVPMKWYNDRIIEENIGDFVADCVNEDLWDSDAYIYDSDANDYNDEWFEEE